MRISNNFNTSSTLKVGRTSRLFSLNGRFISNPAPTNTFSKSLQTKTATVLQHTTKPKPTQPTPKPQRRGCASCSKRR